MRWGALLAAGWVMAFLLSCDENNNFVIFSIDNDVQLGAQVSEEIASDPSIRILPRAGHASAYAYIEQMRDAILQSGKITYKEQFAWNVYLIDNDTVLNAFATPGGYIYLYSGLIKYLDRADDLAGVLGHEMAHADKRHTVRNLQKMYGIQILLSVALGNNPSALEEIAAQIGGQLAGLKFSREYETEADESSVEYLAPTAYACNGAASFFVKLNEEGGGRPPEFLSTHPNPENRVANINMKASALGCDTQPAEDAGYEAFKSSLP